MSRSVDSQFRSHIARCLPTNLRALPALLVVVAALVAALTLGAGQAQANHVSCGDEITVDTTLDSDLVNCPSNGIVVGADDVTLDLNDHKVTGDGEFFEPCPTEEFCDVGLLNDGHDRVTVKDGAVRRFAFGVFIGRARQNRVLGIFASKHTLFGFVVAESARSVIRGSSGSNNLAPEGDGLGLFGSDHVRIVDNSFRHNPLGIHVEDSTDNLIKGNRISRNADFGIFMQGDRNQVRRNRCARNDICVAVGPGNRNVIARNRISRGVAGIGLEKGRGNLVVRNVVVHPRRAGIYLGFKNPPIGGADNVVRRNRVSDSGGDGFRVSANDHRSLLRHNVARGAADDGFDVDSRSARLTGNRALRNGDLGIEAVGGVDDGGGNIARYNADPRQCTHILCA